MTSMATAMTTMGKGDDNNGKDNKDGKDENGSDAAFLTNIQQSTT